MGTRGWIVFLHKGVYYRFYNHWDSYFEGLGADLIKVLVSGGDELLVAMRTYLDLGIIIPLDEDADIADEIGPPSPENPDLVAEWEAAEQIVQTLTTRFQEGDMELQNHKEDPLTFDQTGLGIEFIYVIDLDREQFLSSWQRDRIIYGYPIAGLDPVAMDYANEEKLAEGGWRQQCFPVPKAELDHMQAKLKGEGYQLEQLEPISLGLDACVFEAFSIESGEKVFIKVFYGEYERQKRPRAVAEMLLDCPHPNIVRIIKVDYNRLFLEAYDGDLSEVFSELKLDCYQQARVVCHALSDVAQGIIFMHRKGMIHHDIKPKNILVRMGDDQKSVHAAICDFESIGVPFSSTEMELDWGPFAPFPRSRFGSRFAVHPEMREKDGHWLKGWKPAKWTNKYAHPNRETANPWSLDAYSLSVIVDQYLGYFCALEAVDEVSKKNIGKIREEVVTILRDDNVSQDGVCENLDKVSQLLRTYDAVVGEREKEHQQSNPGSIEE